MRCPVRVGAMAQASSNDLLARWRAGDEAAAAELFRRYASRLIGLARSRLSAQLHRRLDPEDVVQSVYRSFFAGAKDGRYQPPPGGELWGLLVAMTLHKLHQQARHNARGKRAVGRDEGYGSEDSLIGLHGALAHEPSPEESAA